MSKLNLQAKPYEMYGYTEGSNSPMTSALAFTKNMNAKQSNLNTVGGKRSIHRKRSGRGKRSIHRKRSGRGKRSIHGKRSGRGKRSMHGGDNGSVTVPQFPQIGPILSPINSNTSSIQTNTTSIATKNNAVNDCYAFGNCPTVGGTRKHKRSQYKRSQYKHKRSQYKHKRSQKHKRSKGKNKQ